jgi:hypothetical protein
MVSSSCYKISEARTPAKCYFLPIAMQNKQSYATKSFCLERRGLEKLHGIAGERKVLLKSSGTFFVPGKCKGRKPRRYYQRGKREGIK